MRRKKFDSTLKSAADLLRTIAHPDRLRLLGLLQGEEMDVTHLQQATGISQSAVSQHLKLLKLQKLVAERRAGQHVYYRLSSPRVKDLVLSAIHLQMFDLVTDPETLSILNELQSLWGTVI